MRYYTIIKNKAIYEKYIKEHKGDVAIISFSDENFEDIYACFKLDCEAELEFDEGMLKAVNFEFVSEDNRLYRMNYYSGEVTRAGKFAIKKLFKQYNGWTDYVKRVEDKKNYIANNYQKDTLIKQKSLILNYRKYNFIDRENLLSIAFRFKKSSNKCKMPLVIYFHGAGALGSDNKKQFWEYKFMGLGLSKRHCNVLIPQNDYAVGENISIIKQYCKSIKKLIGFLMEIADIDCDRIYIVGASYGGACVWYSMYEFPKFYAAAVPVMGYFPSYNKNEFEIKTFKDENIWIGHAMNDNVVPIKDDNTMYELLKNAGYNVRMTKYSKYGHKMSGIFFRREKWKKWLFEQKIKQL